MLVPRSYSFPCVTASYMPHMLPRYADNPLISALRFPDTVRELRELLTYLPTFNDDMRRLPSNMRRLLLEELSRFRIGINRLMELAEHVNGTMLESYAGRVPFSPESNARLQELYEYKQKKTEPPLPKNGAQFAGAMFGSPGCGKTFAIDAVAGLYEAMPVIHHPELAIQQIPIISLSMPFLGMSRKTLGTAIILELVKRLPEANYDRLYLSNTRLNSNELLLTAFALLQTHYVGYVLIDEAQSPMNIDFFEDHRAGDGGSRKKRKDSGDASADGALLATLLIAMSNQSHVPVLFMGTPELRTYLGSRLSMLRRSVGSNWGPLSLEPGLNGKPSEFDHVFGLLWTYQLLRNPAPYTERFRQLFHFYSFGIADIVVKLFYRVQKRALFDGLETITEELVHRVAANEMKDVTESAIALRDQDHAAARDRLMGMTDVRTTLNALSSVGQSEFGPRHLDVAWTPQRALEHFLQALDGAGDNQQPKDAEEAGNGSLPAESPAAQDLNAAPDQMPGKAPEVHPSAESAASPAKPRRPSKPRTAKKAKPAPMAPPPEISWQTASE